MGSSVQEMFGQVGGPATFTSGYQGGSASAASSSSSFMQEGKAQMRMGMMTMSGF